MLTISFWPIPAINLLINMKNTITLILLILSFQIFTVALAQQPTELYPIPKSIDLLPAEGLSTQAAKVLREMVLPFSSVLQDASDSQWVISKNPESQYLVVSIQLDDSQKPQGYRLEFKGDSIRISAADKAGIFYAWQSLKQLSATPGGMDKAMVIEDHPDFLKRGYMLDISRDKVPSMTSLYTLVDRLALLKYNELQLYTEHTFAYKDHEEVWRDASPMTPEEIRKLDVYCRLRNIDLVPNQNSFGHMERWLEHDSYLHLAECPDDCNTIWGLRKRHSLDPTNPGSLELMRSLYDELLPNFSSDYFNIGCDETIELGLGRSAARCREIGKGRVYLNYLKKLQEEASRHGKKVQFWGDIILNHPDLIEELPKDITALVWGYSADYPFKEHLPKFEQAGIDYYVAPGTSTWRSLIGRNPNAFTNLENAAKNGLAYGAKGYLLTDWGDHGHWQPQVISLPSVIVAASLSWNAGVDPKPGLAPWMDRHIFQDPTQMFSKALLALGQAYTQTGIPPGNANIFHLMLHRYPWSLKGNYQTREMTKEGLEQGDEAIVKALEILARSTPKSPDAHLLKEELTLAARLSRHAVELGKHRLTAREGAVKNIPEETRKILASELDSLITQHRNLWIQRNRPGGLEDSAKKMVDLKNYYLDR